MREARRVNCYYCGKLLDSNKTKVQGEKLYCGRSCPALRHGKRKKFVKLIKRKLA